MKSPFSIFKKSSRSFEEQEKGEEVILLLRRHPLVIILPMGICALAALVPIAVFVIFYSHIANSPLFLPFLFLSNIYWLILWIVAFYSLTMYTLNTVLVTDRRIIDRDQHGFFNREVSELHLYRVQDVTVFIRGILETLFRYGDVIVQTAASEKQFVFHQMPDPEKVKDAILETVATKYAGMRSYAPAEHVSR